LSVLTEDEKTRVVRIIDEYDFVSIVLKYKATMMPKDLVSELAQQNNINLEIIMQVMGKDPTHPVHRKDNPLSFQAPTGSTRDVVRSGMSSIYSGRT
jgi:hypothetical protein